MRRRWQSCPSLLIGNQGGKALKWLPAHFNFERKNRLLSRERVHKFGTFCPKVRRGTRDGAFIYALSADETSPAFAALRNAITALFFCRFKCHCPPQRQRYFHGNADRAYNTLHFASKVVCQGASPFGNPNKQQKGWISRTFPVPDIQPLFVVSSPISWSAFCVLVHNVSIYVPVSR